ncbi:D-inositol 3-phosphate glycosyltransferase [Aurantimicrobium sp. MWH-Uga1]|nr:D-inositol 3-phosphate glycosyltransferase [Aurantimicrobium sp. MWH-Uga1]
MKKVLYDLSIGHRTMGFSGIPQDSRVLFQTLSKCGEFETTGLVLPSVTRFLEDKNLSAVAKQALLLADGLNEPGISLDASVIEKLLKRHGQKYRTYVRSFWSSRGVEKLDKQLNDVVWRNYFQSTLPPNEFENILNHQFKFTFMGRDQTVFRTLNNFSSPKLNTKGFDYFITQDSLTINLNPQTKHIVRYHDGLPVLAADTMHALNTRLHAKNLSRAKSDSIYVCNSPSALSDLNILEPRLAENAVVIPYTLPDLPDFSGNLEIAVADIMTMRESEFSRRVRGTSKDKKPVSVSKPYIMSLATIEPRKNYETLIHAWRRLRHKTGIDVNLMIVGKPGWKYEKTLIAMEPFVREGELIHLESVAQSELVPLYRKAAMFVFPSMGEGFGLPPIEAMRCGTPTLMSDIPAHRYSGGSGARFFNPYDVEELSILMERVLSSNAFARELEDDAKRNSNRFTDENNIPLWNELLK